MNLIIFNDNNIKYIEMQEYKITNINNVHIEFLCAKEDIKQNYVILKSEIQNNIQIIDNNFSVKLLLQECYFENTTLIIEGWLQEWNI